MSDRKRVIDMTGDLTWQVLMHITEAMCNAMPTKPRRISTRERFRARRAKRHIERILRPFQRSLATPTTIREITDELAKDSVIGRLFNRAVPPIDLTLIENKPIELFHVNITFMSEMVPDLHTERFQTIVAEDTPVTYSEEAWRKAMTAAADENFLALHPVKP